MADPTVVPAISPEVLAESNVRRNITLNRPEELHVDTNAGRVVAAPKLLQPIPEGMVPVVGPTGDTGLIPQSEFEDPSFRESGYRIASPEEIRRQQAHEIYGHPGSSLVSTGLGGIDIVTSGAGGGIMHAAAKAIGGQDAADTLLRHMQGYQDENPNAYTIGQVLGVLLPTIATGGAAGLAEGAAEAATSVVGRGALRHMVRWGTQGALEGALYGAGSAFTEDELGGRPQTAERLMAGAWKGGLIGGAIGGSMGLAGGALMKYGGQALGKLPDTKGLAGALATHALQMSDAERKVAEALGIDTQRLGRFIFEEPEIRAAYYKGASIEEIAKAAETASQRISNDVTSAVEHIDTVATTTGIKPDVQKLIKQVEEEVVGPLERSPFHTELATRVQKKIDDLGLKAGVYEREPIKTDIAADIAEATSHDISAEQKATYEKITGKKWEPTPQEEVAKARTELPRGKTIMRDALTGKPVIKGPGEISFKQLEAFKQDLRRLVIDEKKVLSSSEFVQQLQKVHDIMENHFVSEASSHSPEAAIEYAAKTEKAKTARFVSETAASSATRRGGAFELKNMVPSMGLARKLGPKFLAMVWGTKVLRERGPQFFAGILDRAGRLGALRGASEAVSNEISRIATRIARSTPRAAVAVTLDRSRQADKAMKVLGELAHNPHRIKAIVEKHVDGQIAPNTQNDYVLLNIKAVQFLWSMAPKGTPIMPMLPNSPTTPVSKSQKNAWMRWVDVFNNPLGEIMSAIRKGRLTKDHVDALELFYGSTVAPELRNAVVFELTKLAQEGKTPSAQHRQQLGLLLRAGTDAALQPEFITSQQAIVNAPPEHELFDNKGEHEVQQRSKANRSTIGGGEESLDEEDK